MDIIRNLPSITVTSLGKINFRGSSGLVVLVNNKPIQSDINSLLNQIPANSIKNIEIITAPSAQYDAEGKAAIINILTIKNALQGYYFQSMPYWELRPSKTMKTLIPPDVLD